MSVAENFEKLTQASLKFLVPLSLDETYKTVCKEAIRMLDAKAASIFLKQGSAFPRIYTTWPKMNTVKARRRANVYYAFKSKKPIVKSIYTPGGINPDAIKIGINSYTFIPLSYKKRSLGVLSVASNQVVNLTEHEEEILMLFGNMATLAIKKAQLYSETEKALKIRDLFMSMAAHELKTPLTTISGYIQMLHGKFKDSSTSEGRWIGQLMVESKRLTNLIDELLLTNKIKSGEFQYTWKECSIRDILRQAIATFQFNYPDQVVFFEDTLEVNFQDVIIGDFEKLRQVFDNILDNAGKFSPPGTPISVSLMYKDPYFEVVIEDKGKGISQEDMPHIFEEFYKGGVTKDLNEGMGLGLFLVRKIIQRHKGTIKVDSDLKHGTKVEVRLKRMVL